MYSAKNNGLTMEQMIKHIKTRGQNGPQHCTLGFGFVDHFRYYFDQFLGCNKTKTFEMVTSKIE